MIIAAIAHVDGNIHALRAVFDTLDEQGIHEVIGTGNFVVGHSTPGEVIDLLQEKGTRCVMGSDDRKVVRAVRAKRHDKVDKTARDTYELLSTAHLEWLTDLRVRKDFSLEGVEISAYFGSPNNLSRQVSPDDNEMIFQRMAEETRRPINIIGGDGQPFTRIVGGTTFIAPGRVSNTSHAQYALIDTDATPYRIELNTVEYSDYSANSPKN